MKPNPKRREIDAVHSQPKREKKEKLIKEEKRKTTFFELHVSVFILIRF